MWANIPNGLGFRGSAAALSAFRGPHAMGQPEAANTSLPPANAAPPPPSPMQPYLTNESTSFVVQLSSRCFTEPVQQRPCGAGVNSQDLRRHSEQEGETAMQGLIIMHNVSHMFMIGVARPHNTLLQRGCHKPDAEHASVPVRMQQYQAAGSAHCVQCMHALCPMHPGCKMHCQCCGNSATVLYCCASDPDGQHQGCTMQAAPLITVMTCNKSWIDCCDNLWHLLQSLHGHSIACILRVSAGAGARW